MVFRLSPVLLSLLLFACGDPSGEPRALRGAVASNFAPWAEELGREFTRRGGSEIAWSRGSTGKLYAQIVQGADFDLFLAADSRRPRLLVEEGLAVPGSRFTYARGRLALWTPGRSPAPELLRSRDLRIALANPIVAPYGEAAREVLERMESWSPDSSRLVRGENVGQAFAFVRTGAVDLGLVALSSARRGGVSPEELWIVPAGWHRPLEQQGVLLVAATRPGAAADFLDFLGSEPAREILERAGYRAGG